MADLLHANEVLGCEIAIIDNLNFVMPALQGENPNSEMDKTIHDFISFTKRVPMHLMLLMHPNKANESGRVESERDVKGSSTVIQEASNLLLWNEVEQNSVFYKKTRRELTFSKLRFNGKHNGSKIIFDYDNGIYSEVHSS